MRRTVATAAVAVILVAACGGITKEERDMGWAANMGDVERVQALLESGVDPNALSDVGYPFITEAAAGGELEVIEILYAAGADPTALTRNGNTAFFHLANGSGDVAIGRWLLDHGVDPCVPVVDSVLPLDDKSLVSIATFRGNVELAELIRHITADC